MPRTVFSHLTERASQHLLAAEAGLPGALAKAPAHDESAPFSHVVSEQRDLAAALAHLGRTVRGRSHERSDSSTDRLLASLDRWANPRQWTEEPQPSPASVIHEMRQAARCIRAAADLWSTHRTRGGRPRSPEASQLRHPSMGGAAMRHWQTLVGQAASLASQLARTPAIQQGPGAAILAAFPRPTRVPADLRPVPLPVARPGLSASADILEAIDDRVDRIHRHIWEIAESHTMSAAVLINAAAIGMLLAGAASEADRRAVAADRRSTRLAERPAHASDRAADVTLGDLERWAEVAAAVTVLRTPDVPTTVLQVERLDLARLLERALARRPPVGAGGPSLRVTAERLARACERYRAVAVPCAGSVRRLSEQQSLFMVGRHLGPRQLSKKPELLAARLGDRLVQAPPAIGRRVEARLQAVSAAGPSAGSAA